ncbi:hypothetical protein [Streptomyces griseorubiginosus]|uniref:hypothetical protein n=1 Tax=Streptomyces griseorubiginosus TaxID=67304 RepID=UPI003330EF09
MSDDMANVIKLFQEDPQDTVRRRMHLAWESAFHPYGLTLMDATCADSLRAAISVVDGLLDGACALEMITPEQRDTLRAHIDVGLSAADEFQHHS